MVSYSEDSQAINITDALPMTDADALSATNLDAANESFAFTVATSASNAVTIPYSISLTPATDPEDDEVALTNNQIKVYLTKGGAAVSETSTPQLVSALDSYTGHSRTGAFLLHSDTADVYGATGGSTTSEYVLKMWIDSSVEIDNTQTMVYMAKVNVDSDVTPIGS